MAEGTQSMKRIVIDPLAFDGPNAAFPAHCYAKLKEAGFRLKPLMTIAPTEGDVIACLEQPWQITNGRAMGLTFVQSD